MTAAATILALIPLALSSGGGLIAASLATVVIGGLLSSTLLTLVVIPVIYSLLAGRRGRGTRSSGLEAWTPPMGQAPRDARPPEPVAVGRES
jgi:HAE1 family hydrophobic/amphiphilic exporter-1